MDRLPLTPGKLYARLSAAFDAHPRRTCRACRMPMVAPRMTSSPDEPNWNIDPLPLACAECAPLVAAVVADCARRFSLFDPAATLRSARGFYARRDSA